MNSLSENTNIGLAIGMRTLTGALIFVLFISCAHREIRPIPIQDISATAIKWESGQWEGVGTAGGYYRIFITPEERVYCAHDCNGVMTVYDVAIRPGRQGGTSEGFMLPVYDRRAISYYIEIEPAGYQLKMRVVIVDGCELVVLNRLSDEFLEKRQRAAELIELIMGQTTE